MSGGFRYPQPIFNSSVYNPGFYLSLDPSGFLSYSYAQTLYLSRYDYRLTYISGITPGIATAGVALVLGNDLSLSNLGAVSCLSLTISGSAINPSLLSATPGIAAAGKALVLGNDLSLSGLGALSCSSLNVGGSLITASAAELNYLDISTLGTFQASKAMTLNANGVGLMGQGSPSANCVRFYGGTQYKEIVSICRPTDEEGLVIATKAQTIQKCSPLLRLYSGYESSGVVGSSAGEYKEVIRSEHKLIGNELNIWSGWWHAYLVANQPWQSTGGFGYGTQWYSSMPALNICCNSSATSSFTAGSNMLITSENAFCFNTLTPASGFMFTLNGNSTRNGIYLTGDSTMLQLFNTQSINTGRTSIVLSGTNFTSWEVSIGGTGHATVPGGMYWYSGGSTKMILSSTGRLGLGGVTAPVCTLDVGASASVTTTLDVLTNTYAYNIASNVSSNFGGGPMSMSMCARFRGNIWVQDKLYAISDRRVKEDIETLDFSLDHYKQLRPVTFRFRNELNTKLGVIAQELLPICREALMLTPNEEMKVEDEGDIEGVQLGVDYSSITLMNTVAIKKILGMFEELQAKL